MGSNVALWGAICSTWLMLLQEPRSILYPARLCSPQLSQLPTPGPLQVLSYLSLIPSWALDVTRIYTESWVVPGCRRGLQVFVSSHLIPRLVPNHASTPSTNSESPSTWDLTVLFLLLFLFSSTLTVMQKPAGIGSESQGLFYSHRGHSPA